jgi:hypothetical protein
MSCDRSPEKLGIPLYSFLQGIDVDDVEFPENPNSVLIGTVCEYYFSHSAVVGFGWVLAKFDEV